jgi:flavodoxin
MKRAWFLLAAVLAVLALGLQPQLAAKTKKEGRNMQPKKILVAYFSHSGNTRELAKQIQALTGGDLFEIVPEKAYPAEYNAVLEQAKEELSSGVKPKLKTKLKHPGDYGIVLIGSPNWLGTVAGPVRAFLTEYDMSGKTVAPFITYGSSGLGSSARDVSRLCPRSTVLDALAVRGADVKSARDQVSAWLRKLKLPESKK